MKFLLQVALIVYINCQTAESLDHTKVVASLYDTVTLRCWFPFLRGSEGLTVVWEKKDQDGKRLMAHKFAGNQDDLQDQDIHYLGRTELSKEFSLGTVDLTLKDVSFKDEGTYHCRAANSRGHGGKKVELTINKLNADELTATVVHNDGKKCLKCVDIGVFRNPWVRWYDGQGTDLSEYGTRNITDRGHGKKMVESMLQMDVETNKHYFCQIKEGRLKRTARAVISDGNPVTITETKLPE